MDSFDIRDMRSAVEADRVEWQRHALQRMVERGIARADVRHVLLTGQRIEDYPDDYPKPSALFLGWCGNRPVHVVVAFDTAWKAAYVITVYEPSLDHFELDFRTRRPT